MSEDQSAVLLARWKKGDQRAADEIYHRFVDRLVALASSRLNEKLQRRVAPEDVVQSVYRSFFRAAQQDRYHCEQSGALWRLLASITINKVRQQVEFHSAKRRSFRCEDSVQSVDGVAGLPPESLARDPTPEEATAMLENLTAILESLEPVHREVLELRLQGHSIEDVAVKVNRSHRTVRRVLEMAQNTLRERLLEAEEHL